jgi:hypothetical protein
VVGSERKGGAAATWAMEGQRRGRRNAVRHGSKLLEEPSEQGGGATQHAGVKGETRKKIVRDEF